MCVCISIYVYICIYIYISLEVQDDCLKKAEDREDERARGNHEDKLKDKVIKYARIK